MSTLPKKIKLMADYDCWCIWDMELANDAPYNIDPNTFPITDKLKSKLSAWEDTYDTTLVRSNPIDSGFKTHIDFEKFIELGWSLFEELRNELPMIKVHYFDKSNATLYEKRPNNQ